MDLIQVVTGEGKFSTADQLMVLREERCEGKKTRDDTNSAKLKGIVK